MSDETLVAGLASGDRDAASAFVQRFQRRVFGLARTIVFDDRAAEDIAQEAFVRAWKHAGAYDPRRGSVVGWLLTITRNLAIEIETQRAAAIDQATQMATANDLLVSLHRLAQTLPASFDLGEVVESIRQRVRALFPYTTLVVLVPDDAGGTWRVELAEGVRVPARFPTTAHSPSWCASRASPPC